MVKKRRSVASFEWISSTRPNFIMFPLMGSIFFTSVSRVDGGGLGTRSETSKN